MYRGLLYLAIAVSALHAADSPPGQIHLTPKIDLHLEPAPVEGLPGRTLNLTPGFKVTLFSDQVDKTNAPQHFALDPNYPNPFNSSTTIRYRLGEMGKVRLEVYDLQGQKVKTLVDRYEGTGFYQLEWDGTDANGHSVATGVYLVRLQTQNAGRVRKMLLLK